MVLKTKWLSRNVFKQFAMSAYWPKYLILNWVFEAQSLKVNNASKCSYKETYYGFFFSLVEIFPFAISETQSLL